MRSAILLFLAVSVGSLLMFAADGNWDATFAQLGWVAFWILALLGNIKDRYVDELIDYYEKRWGS